MSIQTWVNGLIKTAVDEALADIQNEIVAEVQAMEKNLTTQIALLPGNIVSAVNGQLAGFPQQVISGVLQGIPSILNPFKGRE